MKPLFSGTGSREIAGELAELSGKHRPAGGVKSPRLRGKECAMAGSLQPRPLAASLCLRRPKRYAVPPGARNRSQINVARAVSSRLARVSAALPPYKDNIPGRVSIILFRRVRYRSRPLQASGSLFSTTLSRTRPSLIYLRPHLLYSDFLCFR